MESIGDRVRRTRESKGIARGDLARAIGLSYTGLSDLELGKAKNTTKLHRLASELGVDVQWLETGKGSPEPRQPAPESVSRPVRLDADIVRGVARAMQEVFDALHYQCSVTDTIAIFAELYDRVSASGIATADVVWLARRVEQGAANAGRSNLSSG
jgi:transcriptional regulator with XRE-family HTH domain